MLHSKIRPLNLDNLENICYSKPELFDHLVKLRRKLRNTYEHGNLNTGGLHQIPISEPLSASPNSNVIHDEEGYQDGEDDSVGDEESNDENVDKYEVAGKPTFARPVDDIHSEEDEEEERPESGRVTRFRGKKHVPVYKSKMITSQHISALPNKTRSFQTVRKSIIHCDNYSRMHNFEVKYFRAEGKDIFYARKRALLAHVIMCKESFCELCQLNKKVQTFKYMASNLARYNDTIESTAKP